MNKATIMKELEKVTDPEIGIPITKMKLIDEIKVDKGNISVEFHLTTPFCPPMFASQIASNIKSTISKIKGVKSVQVTLKNHFMAEQINKSLK